MRPTVIRLFLLCLIAILIFGSGEAKAAFSGPRAETASEPPTIVLGFVGGFIRHDDPNHSEVQLAERLRKEYSAGVVVETYSNHRGKKVYRRILELLDADHDGVLSSAERRSARIILYGHSWGASESVTLARRLQRDGIPVLLVVQVDSISKIGQDDQIIPSNVAQAANFFQEDGLLQGESEIRAADPAHTQIQGNFRFYYSGVPYNGTGYPWYARIFMKAHTQIESDPKVWNQVEKLIRAVLSNPMESGSVLAPQKP